MKLAGFKIENYKNITIAEASNLPDFVVICGSNGCGKSSLLEAIFLANNCLMHYYDRKNKLETLPYFIASDSDHTSIELEFSLTSEEIDEFNHHVNLHNQREKDSIERMLAYAEKNGSVNLVQLELTKRAQDNIIEYFNYDTIYKARVLIYNSVSSIPREISSNRIQIPQLDLFYIVEEADKPETRIIFNNFFFGIDFFDAIRPKTRHNITNWDSKHSSKEKLKQIQSNSASKFQEIKQYLLNLKMNDLKSIQASLKEGKIDISEIDSLDNIRSFFSEFFTPMRFGDIDLNATPFKFEIITPKGIIDIDELSSGEKEVLFTYIHFQRYNTDGAIILFDEPDAHLHPELERKYLKSLKSLNQNNQFFITTHSPNMMIETGSESLYTLTKYSTSEGENQFRKVTENQEIHNILSELMGSRGFVSLDRKIVFIEGIESSTDKYVFESFYPSDKYNITFVPAESKNSILNTAEKVNCLLTQSLEYQHFYSIVDKDLDRLEEDPTGGTRVFYLPVYHVENFLLNENVIFEITNTIKKGENLFTSSTQVKDKLLELALV